MTVFRKMAKAVLLSTVTFLSLFIVSFATAQVALSLSRLSRQVLQVRSNWYALSSISKDLLYHRIDAVDRLDALSAEWRNRIERMDASLDELLGNPMLAALPRSAREHLDHGIAIWQFTTVRLHNARRALQDIVRDDPVLERGSSTLMEAVQEMIRESTSAEQRRGYRFFLANIVTVSLVGGEIDLVLSAIDTSIPVFLDRWTWGLIIAAFAGTTLATILSLRAAGKAAKPIQDLSVAMDKIRRKDFAVDFPISAEQEIENISEGVREMLKTIDALVAESVREEKEKQDLEWQVLQNQINPHFLYNTIGSLQLTAAAKGDTAIADSLKSLGRILRNAFSQENRFQPLSMELRMLGDYLAILQLRYERRIELKLRVEKDAERVPVPKLILQPLVENAVMHGLSERLNRNIPPALIEIRAGMAGREGVGPALTVIVEDNGCGIPEDRLSGLLAPDKGGRVGGIGLRNTDERIRAFYGDGYGLRIESDGKSFTRVGLELPAAVRE